MPYAQDLSLEMGNLLSLGGSGCQPSAVCCLGVRQQELGNTQSFPHPCSGECRALKGFVQNCEAIILSASAETFAHTTLWPLYCSAPHFLIHLFILSFLHHPFPSLPLPSLLPSPFPRPFSSIIYLINILLTFFLACYWSCDPDHCLLPLLL